MSSSIGMLMSGTLIIHMKPALAVAAAAPSLGYEVPFMATAAAAGKLISLDV